MAVMTAERGLLPTDRKMPCGCWGVLLRQGNTHLTWVVTASAFLCAYKHCQGDVVVEGAVTAPLARLAELSLAVHARGTRFKQSRDEEDLLAALSDLIAVVRVLEQIADPSYVGNYDLAHIVAIYRRWAKNALAALEGGAA